MANTINPQEFVNQINNMNLRKGSQQHLSADLKMVLKPKVGLLDKILRVISPRSYLEGKLLVALKISTFIKESTAQLLELPSSKFETFKAQLDLLKAKLFKGQKRIPNTCRFDFEQSRLTFREPVQQSELRETEPLITEPSVPAGLIAKVTQNYGLPISEKVVDFFKTTKKVGSKISEKEVFKAANMFVLGPLVKNPKMEAALSRHFGAPFERKLAQDFKDGTVKLEKAGAFASLQAFTRTLRHSK